MEPEKKELWVKFDPAIPDDVQRDLFAQLAEIIRQAAGPEYAVVRIEHEPDDDEGDAATRCACCGELIPDNYERACELGTGRQYHTYCAPR